MDMPGPPPDTTPSEQQPAEPLVPDLSTLGTLIHDPHRQSILDIVRRLARPSLAASATTDTDGSSFVFPVSVPSRMCRDHVDSLLHTDYFVYERAVGVRLLMLIMRPEDGVPGNQVFLINAAKIVRRVVFPCPDNQSSTHHETLIDGCLVSDRGQNGAPDSLRFLCLDMLAVHGRADVAAKSLDRRLGMLDMEVIRPHRNFYRLRRTSSTALHSPSEQPAVTSSSSSAPTGNSAKATSPPCPFVLSLQVMERSYGLIKVLDQVIPSLRHACQGLVFAPVRQPFKAGPCADTYHWIPPRAVTLLVDTVRAGDRLEPDLDPRNPYASSDAILTDPIAFKLLARITNDPEGRLRGVGRVDLDRSTHAAWALEPPKRRFGVFAWDPVSQSGQSTAGGWKWIRWIASEEDGVVADTIDDACRAIEEARSGVPDGVLRGKMEMIRAAWKAREASQAGAGNRSASTDQLTSPTAGEFAKEGGLRKRALSNQQPVVGGTPSAATTAIPPWQHQQQSQQLPAPSTGGYRPWSASSSASQPPNSPLGSDLRTRSESLSAPASTVLAPIDRFKSPTSPTPVIAGLPPKPPPLPNVSTHRARERDRDQDTGGFGPPPPMPPYLGLPRRRSLSESQELLGSAVSSRAKGLPAGESEEGNREQRGRSGSETGGTSALRLPPKPQPFSLDLTKAGSPSGHLSEPLGSDLRSPISAANPASDYANSTAAKLRSQPAPEPVPLNLSRRRSSTGPTPAMAAAATASASANASTKSPDSQPSSPNPMPRTRRQSSLSIAVDTMTNRSHASAPAAAASPLSPVRPGSPLRPKTPTSGGRLVESPTARGRSGRVSRLSSPNKPSPSPGRIAALVAGDMSDTSSGVPMDLDSSMAVGLGVSASPEPRRMEGKLEVEEKHVREGNGDPVDRMEVDEAVPAQPSGVAGSDGQRGSLVGEPRPQASPSKRPHEAPVPAQGSPVKAISPVAQPESPLPDPHPRSEPSSSPPRTMPSRSMRHALGIASPTQPDTVGAASHALTLPLASIPAPLPPGVAVLPRVPSPPPKSQLAALLTSSSTSSSPIPMPHIPTPSVPPLLLKTGPTSAAPTPAVAATGGGQKRKQPVSTESSPSAPSLASSRAKRARKGSAMEVKGASSATEAVTSPPSDVAKLPNQAPAPAGESAPSVVGQPKPLLFASNSTSYATARASSGQLSVAGQSGHATSALPPPPHLTIDTAVAAQTRVPRRAPLLGQVAPAPAQGSVNSLPSGTQSGLSHSASHASLSNTAKMSFAFLLNDSGDDAMDVSPGSSPVRQTPASPQQASAPLSASAAATRPTDIELAQPAKTASRRSDYDHEMTDEDVAALLTSMQSPSNVRPGTAASSARQSRQPTPKSSASTTQPPLPQPQQVLAVSQQQTSGRSLQSPKPPPGVPQAAGPARKNSVTWSQPPTPHQQPFPTGATQQQQQQAVQYHQQQRRPSTASMSEHSQGYTPGPSVPMHGPPHRYAPPAQGPPQLGYQPPAPAPSQPQPQYRPPRSQLGSPQAYHFTLNTANIPGSPTAVAPPPSHSPPPVASAHDPRAQLPPPPTPPGAPPAQYSPYGYHGHTNPASPYGYGYPQPPQPPLHHQHQQQFQQQQAAVQYQQQLQHQQQAAQAHAQAHAQAQYMATLQRQQQQHAANSYPYADPYGRRPSIPGPGGSQPSLPPGYRPPPGPR